MPRSTALRSGARRMADDQTPVTPSPDPDGTYHLRLYVAGQSPKSVRAVENLRSLADALS